MTRGKLDVNGASRIDDAFDAPRRVSRALAWSRPRDIHARRNSPRGVSVAFARRFLD